MHRMTILGQAELRQVTWSCNVPIRAIVLAGAHHVHETHEANQYAARSIMQPHRTKGVATRHSILRSNHRDRKRF
jgi:hypothetical protein